MASHALGLIELEDRKKRSSTSLTRGEEDHVPSKNNGVDLMLGPSRSNARFPSQNSPADGEQNQIDSPAADSVSRTTLVIVTLSGVNFLNTLGSGILTVGLPRMAVDLALNPSILFWPASVYALAAGCTLLLFGSLADVIGDKRIWLTGSIMYTVFTLACGLAQTAIQLIVFRTFLGLSIAMCLPSGVSLMTRTCPPGSRRNVGFACMGVGQPLGYAVGLVVGGVFVDTIGWRYGYYISAVVNGILSAAAFCALPGIPSALSAVGPETGASRRETWYKTLANIDWIGVLFISASLGLLSYVLAQITEDYKRIEDAYIIALLIISVVLLAAFTFWEQWQEERGKPAVIPNSLWRNPVFTTTCVVVFFSWAAFNAYQYFTSLYFQNIQHLSALLTSIRFIPMIVVGAITNIITGFLVDKVRVRTLVVTSAVLTSIAPILMATARPDDGYWRGPFEGMSLAPVHPDVLFTVSNLIISQVFPADKQSIAGGVFNSVAQIGNSVGLAVGAAIASSVTDHSQASDDDEYALNRGYRAAFWLMFTAMVMVCLGCTWGLRTGGKIGKKSE